MADKPTVQFSLTKLRKEVAVADPFHVALSGSKVIEFPDIYAMESEGAEELFSRITRDTLNWKLLGEWLSDADVAALKAEKLKLIELNHLVKTAVQYYEDIYGTPGESAASAS